MPAKFVGSQAVGRLTRKCRDRHGQGRGAPELGWGFDAVFRAGDCRRPGGDGRSGRMRQQRLYQHGVLTVATDKPAYPPWFENNDPANGKGYDSAIARQLGFKPAQVQWSYEPFNDSYAPGLKKFDFDINEISYTPQRATAVTFSNSYYDDHQALVALKSTPIVTKHAPADLKRYIFGGQIGTTSLAYITTEIQPTARPKVFQTLNDVKEALQTNQIAALVTDTPTARYISSSEIPNSLTVAQFPSTGEHYGLLFSKGNPLVILPFTPCR